MFKYGYSWLSKRLGLRTNSSGRSSCLWSSQLHKTCQLWQCSLAKHHHFTWKKHEATPRNETNTVLWTHPSPVDDVALFHWGHGWSVWPKVTTPFCWIALLPPFTPLILTRETIFSWKLEHFECSDDFQGHKHPEMFIWKGKHWFGIPTLQETSGDVHNSGTSKLQILRIFVAGRSRKNSGVFRCAQYAIYDSRTHILMDGLIKSGQSRWFPGNKYDHSLADIPIGHCWCSSLLDI